MFAQILAIHFVAMATASYAGSKKPVPPTVPVCVTVQEKDQAGFVVANIDELRDTERDMRKRLSKRAKDGIAVVETDCKVKVEVAYRGVLAGAPVITQHHGYGLTSKDTPETPIIRLNVVVDDRVVPFEGRGLVDNPFAMYGHAATAATDEIVKWIHANRDAILADSTAP